MKTTLIAVLLVLCSAVSVQAQEWTYEGQGYTWVDATELCASKDMRLPTIDELLSVDYVSVGLTHHRYWTSEVHDYMSDGRINRAETAILYYGTYIQYDAWSTIVRTACVSDDPMSVVIPDVFPIDSFFKVEGVVGTGWLDIDVDGITHVSSVIVEGEVIEIGVFSPGAEVALYVDGELPNTIDTVEFLDANGIPVYPYVEWLLTYDVAGTVVLRLYDPIIEVDDGNNGHGNDADGCDESNPGLGKSKGKGPKQCR